MKLTSTPCYLLASSALLLCVACASDDDPNGDVVDAQSNGSESPTQTVPGMGTNASPNPSPSMTPTSGGPASTPNTSTPPLQPPVPSGSNTGAPPAGTPTGMFGNGGTPSAGDGGSAGERGGLGGETPTGGIAGEGGANAGGSPSEGGAPSGGSGNGGAPAGEPEPSDMCGNGNASPSLNLDNTIVTMPGSYDGSTPVPVIIAFHAAGNPNTQMQGIIGDTFEDEYILIYPKSDGSGWANNADASKVDAIFDALDANVCYDKNRVFATGHSSGAQFVVQRLCADESRWRAVAPVASSVYCSSWEPIPALVIHGIGDVEREAYGLDDGDGLKDIVPYRTSNGCEETYVPVEVEGCSSGGVEVDPGCRDFDGCSEVTRWCQHNDPQYGTSHHGVPCFGARVMKDFFDSYR